MFCLVFSSFFHFFCKRLYISFEAYVNDVRKSDTLLASQFYWQLCLIIRSGELGKYQTALC